MMGGSICASYQVGALQRWGGSICASYKVGTLQRRGGGGGSICAIYQVGTLQRWGVVFVPSTKWVLCKDGGQYLCHLPSGYSAKMGGSICAIY